MNFKIKYLKIIGCLENVKIVLKVSLYLNYNKKQNRFFLILFLHNSEKYSVTFQNTNLFPFLTRHHPPQG